MQVCASRFGDGESRCSHVGLTGKDVGNDLGNAVDCLDHQIDTELVGESPHQVELRARGAVGSLDVGDGTVARDNPQLAGFEYLVQERRR